MKPLIVIVLASAVIAGGWLLVSPLFIDETVDEDLSLLLADGTLDMDKLMSMAPEKRQAMRQDIMNAAAAMPDDPMTEPMPAEPTVIARGQFIDADAVHKGSGDALLYALPDGRHAVRFENFRTTNGPDLVVYLASHPDPKSAADVTDNGFISLGKLKGNVGNQNYPIPAETDISAYGSVVIWCELFGVLFSPAALVPAAE